LKKKNGFPNKAAIKIRIAAIRLQDIIIGKLSNSLIGIYFSIVFMALIIYF
jgi:hypothetical protein